MVLCATSSTCAAQTQTKLQLIWTVPPTIPQPKRYRYVQKIFSSEFSTFILVCSRVLFTTKPKSKFFEHHVVQLGHIISDELWVITLAYPVGCPSCTQPRWCFSSCISWVFGTFSLMQPSKEVQKYKLICLRVRASCSSNSSWSKPQSQNIKFVGFKIKKVLKNSHSCL